MTLKELIERKGKQEVADMFVCSQSFVWQGLMEQFGLTTEEAVDIMNLWVIEPEELKGFDYSIFG